MQYMKKTKQKQFLAMGSPIISQQQNLQELILYKQKQLVLMYNNCLKQEMSQLKICILELQQKLQNQAQEQNRLNQVIFDLQQKITLGCREIAEKQSQNFNIAKINQLTQQVQAYKNQISQLQNCHQIQLNDLRFSCQQIVNQLKWQMDKVKQQKKSQLNYYLNIIGEMQKQIELLRQLNQFYDKNSSIQVKQLKFQKSLDSLVKSDHDSLNLFEETIKISKINTNLVQKESSEAQNHLNTFKYCDKKDTFQKSYKQKLQKENNDYQKHLSQLKHQIMKNNEKQKFKLLKATIDKRNFRNTSLQRTKIGNKKSQFYVKNCYLPENKIVKSIKAKYEKNKFLVMQSQIDKKLNMVNEQSIIMRTKNEKNCFRVKSLDIYNFKAQINKDTDVQEINKKQYAQIIQ